MKHTIITPTRPSEDQRIYLKVPFVNENIKRQTLATISRSGITNLRTHFMTGNPSASLFSAPRDKQGCPPNCDTCKIAVKKNICLAKNCVYKIKCNLCSSTYIGETGCTIGTRIKEHLRMTKQTIYTHLQTHNINPKSGENINWQILHHNLPNTSERKIIEALTIKASNNLMNGCAGRQLDI